MTSILLTITSCIVIAQAVLLYRRGVENDRLRRKVGRLLCDREYNITCVYEHREGENRLVEVRVDGMSYSEVRPTVVNLN